MNLLDPKRSLNNQGDRLLDLSHRIENAITLAHNVASYDGAHHKAYAIDQIVLGRRDRTKYGKRSKLKAVDFEGAPLR